jgi:serine/threonine protein kinase
MKNFSAQIQYGLLAVEKGFLSQETLAELVQQWLVDSSQPSSSPLGLAEFLFKSGKITEQQFLDLTAELDQTCEISAPEIPTPEPATEVLAYDVPGSPSEGTTPWQSVPQAKPAPDLEQRDKNKRFKIVKKHASGGLGVVYVARDLQINRDVALKQIRADRRQDILSESKFMLEAEITGQLEHPGIVPVYALGVDSDGSPYYAMRFIRGRELKHFIQDFHRLSDSKLPSFDSVMFRQLMRRILDVCNAIEYAHSRGILHRDLKPANIMLGNHGETLVVDWGLAKLISSKPSEIDITESTREFPVRVRSSGSNSDTVYGSFSGTVAYAPPEQLQGQLELLGPASDVYSLGAILYETLTNQPPIVKRPQSMSQVVEWMRAGEVPSAKSIVKTVPTALSMICQKAMAFEIAARYGSAGELASDLERWLADERVLAFGNREPLAEVAGRWLRRYRSWTFPVATALVFSTLVVVVGAWLINRSRIAEATAKSVAVQYKNEAVDRIGVARNAIDTMLVNSSEALQDFPATLDLQSQLLQAAIDDYAKLSQGNASDNELELERIRARVRVADIQHMQGNLDAAYLKYLEVIQETEQKVQRFTKGNDPVALSWKVELGKAHARLGLAYDAERKEGRATDARERFVTGIDILKKTAAETNADSPAKVNLARTLVVFADSHSMSSQTTEAIRFVEDSIQLYEQMDLNRDRKTQLASLQAYEIAGRFLGKQGQTSKAVQYLNLAMTGAEKMLVDDPSNRDLLKFQSNVSISKATIYRRLGDWGQALADLQKASTTYEHLRKGWPNNLEFIENNAIAQLDIGLILLDQLEPSRAAGPMEGAFADFQKLHQAYPQIQRYADSFASACSGLGQVETQTNPDPTASIKLLIEGYNLFDRLFLESDNNISYALKMATTKAQLAQATERTEQRSEAAKLWNDSQVLLKQLIEADSSQTDVLPDYEDALAQVLWRQGLLEWSDGDREKSVALFLESIQVLERLVTSHPTNGQYACELARSLIRCPHLPSVDLPRAEQLALQAYDSHPRNVDFSRLVAECKLQQGQAAEAKKYLDLLPADATTTQDLGLMALYEFRSGNQMKAVEQLREMKERMDAEQPCLVDLHRWYDSLVETIDQ